MGKGGRIACIFTPFVLTLASLVCIILVFLGGTNKSNSTVEKYFFFKADLTNFTSSGTGTDSSLLSSALASANSSDNLKQYYAIYLWNYCAGNGNDAATNDYSYCSARESSFWFNPVEVWGLNSSGIDDLFPTELKDGLKAYKTASHWMFIAYVCALITTIAEIVVGIFAICSRWGSFFTTLMSGLSTFFIIAASITATILFSTLVGTFNTALKTYGIHASLGHSLFVATWLAVAFSLASGFFWFLSVCCCSGRSPYHKDAERSGGFGGMMGGRGRRSVTVEKTPYTYERVESPYLGAQQSGVTHTGAAADYYGNSQQRGGYSPLHGESRSSHPANQNVPMINLQRASRDAGDHPKAGGYEPFRRQ